MTEEIIERDLPIIDAHHHLWDFSPSLPVLPQDKGDPLLAVIRGQPVYLLDELFRDTLSGHNIVATVYMECGSFYRADGPAHLKPTGEVEHANGAAARSASGLYGPIRACSAIVGYADLTLGDEVARVLEALVVAGNGRLRGVRVVGPYDEDASLLGPLLQSRPGLYLSQEFRRGFRHLETAKLSFDAWVFEPQLGDVLDLARAFPNIPVVIDHVGTPLGIGRYKGKLIDRFPTWRSQIRALANCENVSVKLSGLSMFYCGLCGPNPKMRLSSEQLAALWRPYVETCIEAFGPSRAMFASNFPVDGWGADYSILWNAFKRITSGTSPAEKRSLYKDSAARFYRLSEFI